MTGAETTAYVDQYLAAVSYLDQTWPFNRGLAGDEVIAYAVRRALLGDPWESKENGHGYLLVPSLGTRTELNPGITDSDDLREFARGAITGRRLAFCDLCDKPILTSGGVAPRCRTAGPDRFRRVRIPQADALGRAPRPHPARPRRGHPEMNVDEMPTPQLIRLVQTWPTVREVAVEYALPEWWIRTQVERSRVRAMKLTTLRIDPDDWRRFLRDSMTTPAAASPTGPARPAEATT